MVRVKNPLTLLHTSMLSSVCSRLKISCFSISKSPSSPVLFQCVLSGLIFYRLFLLFIGLFGFDTSVRTYLFGNIPVVFSVVRIVIALAAAFMPRTRALIPAWLFLKGEMSTLLSGRTIYFFYSIASSTAVFTFLEIV